MRLLIDPHILIYFLEGNNLLSNSHRQIIADSQNDVFISIASLWEMAIKISVGKLTLSQPFEDVIDQLNKESFEILAISPDPALPVRSIGIKMS
ncbi:MAG: type II toxin-antitoxin system VapC family toxin [Pyrinomonadaceae bacterium]